MRILIPGLIALLVGIAFCFAGYRFFRILVAIWGFITGFLLTEQALSFSPGSHALTSLAVLIATIIVGLILAALAYYLYVAAVVILAASVGFWVGTGIMTALGFAAHSTIAVIVGVILAVILAILTLTLNLTKILIIISTALGGAGVLVGGILLLIGKISLDAISAGVVGAIIQRSLVWSLVWLVLAISGIIVQMSSTQKYAANYPRSQF